MPEYYEAIEIDSPEVANIVRSLASSTLDDVTYEDMSGAFAVLDYPDRGIMTVYQPLQIGFVFDHIEPSTVKMKLVRMFE